MSENSGMILPMTCCLLAFLREGKLSDPSSKNRGQELNTSFFISGTPGISRHHSWDIPPKVWFSLAGHTELFKPHPFARNNPNPTGKYLDPKVWFALFYLRKGWPGGFQTEGFPHLLGEKLLTVPRTLLEISPVGPSVTSRERGKGQIGKIPPPKKRTEQSWKIREHPKPGGPRNPKNKFSLERLKNLPPPPRTKKHSRLKCSFCDLRFTFSIENSNPGPCVSAAREGLKLKEKRSIEKIIPHWKLDFHNIASPDWIMFQSLGPLGTGQEKDRKGRTSPDRESPLFETPRLPDLYLRRYPHLPGKILRAMLSQFSQI